MICLGDIEIKLLKAKLEQTEKTLETVLAQMANINMPNLKMAKKKVCKGLYKNCYFYVKKNWFQKSKKNLKGEDQNNQLKEEWLKVEKK